MVASRWPHRLSFAAVISFSTSASVRCSRLRRAAFGSRFGVTVRFTVAGVTSFRCDLAMEKTAVAGVSVWTIHILRTVGQQQGRSVLLLCCDVLTHLRLDPRTAKMTRPDPT